MEARRARRGKGTLQIYDAGSRSGQPNAHYLQIKADSGGGFGVTNEGFRGMGVEQGKEFLFSSWRATPATAAPVAGRIGRRRRKEARRGRDYRLDAGLGKTYTAVIRPTATNGKARLNLLMDGPGKVDVDLISLYPKETWKNRPNGLRADLVQLLSDLKPGFLRFPAAASSRGGIWRRAINGRRPSAISRIAA